MAPGIFTKYSKQVIGGLIAFFAIIAAALLYFQFRSPVGGPSSYEIVNDLHEWECMTLIPERDVYPTDVETIQLYFRNDAPDGVVCLSAYGPIFAYELEIWEESTWHQMRARVDSPRWNGKTDIVNWNDGEAMLFCEVASDYPTPLQPGRCRIVLPDCAHMNSVSDLAVEFEVESWNFGPMSESNGILGSKPSAVWTRPVQAP